MKYSIYEKEVSAEIHCYKWNINWEGLLDKCGVRLNYLTNHHEVMENAAKGGKL